MDGKHRRLQTIEPQTIFIHRIVYIRPFCPEGLPMAAEVLGQDSELPTGQTSSGKLIEWDDWRVVLGIAGVALALWAYCLYWPPLLVVAITACAALPLARAVNGDEPWSHDARMALSLFENRLPKTELTVVIFCGILAGILIMAGLARWISAFEYLRSLCFYASLVLGTGSLVFGIHLEALPTRRMLVRLSLCCLISVVVISIVSSSMAVATHPVFHTPVSFGSAHRPAVHVVVRDDTEFGGLGTAELYLSVQSSRFPQHVHVILPINRNEFIGCKSRFLQLPFEVADGDVLIFNLLDDNRLSAEDERLLLSACETTGYCLDVAGTIYRPDMATLLRPLTSSASTALGDGAALVIHDSPFRNFGTEEFIVQSVRPTAPNLANRIRLEDSTGYSRASVRVYFPSDAIEGSGR